MHVEESLSDVAASSACLTMNLQPLVQEDVTLVESSHTGGLERIVSWVPCVLNGTVIAKPVV